MHYIFYTILKDNVLLLNNEKYINDSFTIQLRGNKSRELNRTICCQGNAPFVPGVNY